MSLNKVISNIYLQYSKDSNKEGWLVFLGLNSLPLFLPFKLVQWSLVLDLNE